MEPKNPIIIDGVDVSGCIFHSLTTMGYAGFNYCKCFECVCKGYNNCYYKNWQRKEQENERYEQTLIVIEDIAKADFNHTCWETYARQLKQIMHEVGKVLDE